MAEKPVSVETYMSGSTDQVMFTLIYADGYRRSYWLPFWRAIWHSFALMCRGVEVKDVS